MLSDEEEEIYLLWEDKLTHICYELYDYDKAIEEAKTYLQILDENNDAEKMKDVRMPEHYWYTHKLISQCYNHKGNKKIAFEHVIISKMYFRCETHRIYSDWQHGLCYKNVNNRKALVILKKCYKELFKLSSFQNCGSILEEICEVEISVRNLINDIKKLEQLDLTYDDKNKILTIIYNRLDVLCKDENKKFQLAQNIHKINNKQILKILRNKVLCIA